MATTELDRSSTDNHFRLGLLLAIGSALAFGSSGPFAKALIEAGWSPTAAVTARLAGGALAMAIFASFVRPGWVGECLRHAKTLAAYGLVAVVGAQLCYYNAIAHVSVAVALLLEYTAPVLVVGWVWATTRRRPSAMTFAGVGLAVAGIMLVLNVFSGAHVNIIGVGWGLTAAVCAACYFMMSNNVSTDGEGLNPISLATGGLIVGTVVAALLGVTGVLPLTFTTNPVVIAGFTTSWLVPVITLGLIPTAVAYTLGISAIARLKPRFASLVGLSEVLFAVLSAWILLGEAVTVSQAIGGTVVLLGLAVARQGDRSEQARPESVGQVELASWPDMPLWETTERAND
jgi:drug/metabolite transporter (DMT)-like permease